MIMKISHASLHSTLSQYGRRKRRGRPIKYIIIMDKERKGGDVNTPLISVKSLVS